MKKTTTTALVEINGMHFRVGKNGRAMERNIGVPCWSIIPQKTSKYNVICYHDHGFQRRVSLEQIFKLHGQR